MGLLQASAAEAGSAPRLLFGPPPRVGRRRRVCLASEAAQGGGRAVETGFRARVDSRMAAARFGHAPVQGLARAIDVGGEGGA